MPLVTPPSRASVFEGTQTLLLAANLIWTTLCLGGYRPGTLVVTSALTGALFVTHCLACAFEKRAPGSLHAAGWMLLPFLVYAALNVLLVSRVPWLGWRDWFGWANLVAVFWVTLNGIRSKPARRGLFFTLVLIGIAAVLLACYQRFVRPDWLMLGRQQAEQFLGRASGPFGIPNSLAAFLLLLEPAAGALAFRRGATATERVWWGWVTAVFALGLLLTVSRGAWIGLALACVVWPLRVTSWVWPRRVQVALAVLAAAVGVMALIYTVSPKVRERLDLLVRDSGEQSRPILWRAAWNLFREQPLTGTGAGSYNVLFERHRPERFLDEPQWAHNDYLNTLSDYGVMGFALFFGVAAMMLLRRHRQGGEAFAGERSGKPDWLDVVAVRRALEIGVLAFALQLFVDFHFKIPALAMACAVVAALLLSRPANSSFSSSTKKPVLVRAVWLFAIFPLIGGTVAVVRFYRAEARRYEARQMIDAYTRDRTGDLSALAAGAERSLRNAVKLSPGNASAWADLAFALELQALANPARIAELASPAEQAARRALAKSVVVPEFWIRLGVALDMQRRTAEAQKAFEEAVRLAPRNAHPWYYYAYHLSHDTTQRDAALRAVANCLSLDPGSAAAEALQAKLRALPPGTPLVP